MTPALEISGLTAGYGALPVVRDVSLLIEPGEVVALLGANGSGKTTTLLSAAGVLTPAAGTVTLFGHDIAGRRPDQIAREGLMLVPDDRGVFHGLTVRENLRLARTERRRAGRRRLAAAGAVAAAISGVGAHGSGAAAASDVGAPGAGAAVAPGSRESASDAVLDLFPALRPLLGRRCGVLSGGEQQMLALAKALLASPRVLLIDELSLGLAPVIVERLLPVVRQIALERSMAVLLVEQHTRMAMQVADRVCVMRRGRVVLTGAASELRDRHDLLEASYLGDGAGTGTSSNGGRG